MNEDDRVAKLKTPKECAVFAKNVTERGRPDLALAARKRAVQLRAESFGATSEVERECIEAVFAYEEVLSAKAGRRQSASRTWPMIDRHGVIGAVERVVKRKADALGYTFGRQALSMIWDYVEINPLIHSGGWTGGFQDISGMIENHLCLTVSGQAEQLSATEHSLADDCVAAFVTDPPYYDAIPYADLSDFFYVWLRPLLAKLHPNLAVEEGCFYHGVLSRC